MSRHPLSGASHSLPGSAHSSPALKRPHGVQAGLRRSYNASLPRSIAIHPASIPRIPRSLSSHAPSSISTTKSSHSQQSQSPTSNRRGSNDTKHSTSTGSNSTSESILNTTPNTNSKSGLFGSVKFVKSVSMRTSPIHPVRRAPDYRVRELFRLDPLVFFFIGFIPPFVGAVSSIFVALLFHNEQISGYNWQCGRARLPSLSRIINLPMERIFWQFAFLFHIPLRCLELGVGFNRYGRLRSVDTRWPRFYTFSRYMYAILGMLELIFMIALSVVGEREFIKYHVIFFYLFGLFATGFFISNVICHANSLYYLNPYGRLSYRIKTVVLILYFISIPILLGSFLLYWKKCITDMYDVFALMEYTDVFLSIIYHCCAFFDIRYKVVFSVRDVRKIKNQ